MSAGYDGSIKIDTSIDSKGFNSGMKGMTASLKSLALAIALTFSVGAIISFGRAAVDAASEMQSAFIGLQSIVEGQGKSFAGAKDYINEYIADGFVPAANAVTAYKNLLMRGYSTDQIETVMNALKNSSAFGRQASLTMGQAVQSATEGLKNENSILVDNAGVTKNVSMMWKDYAASIGTTIGALTKEQKIEAEVQGILQETRFQMSDAAKLSTTYAGKMSALGVSFQNLKVAIGNSIIPIISAILPYIKAAIDALVVFFNTVAQVMNALFGTNVSMASVAAEMETASGGMSEVADSSGAAANAQGKLAKNTEKAGKAAKGALAAFDDLNVLQMQEPDSSAGSSGSGGGSSAPAAGGIAPALPSIDDTPFGQGLTALEEKITSFKIKFFAFVQPVTDALYRLRDSLTPIGETIWAGLKWAWDNILVPLGAWVITDLLPVFLDLLGGAAELLNSILIALQPTWDVFWTNVLQPLATWTGGVIVDFINSLADALKRLSDWMEANGERLVFVLDIIGGIVGVLWLLNAAVGAINTAIGIYNGIMAVAAVVTGAITLPFLVIVALIIALGVLIYLLITQWDALSTTVSQLGAIMAFYFTQTWEKFKKFLSDLWTDITKFAADTIQSVKDKWNSIGEWFAANVINPLKNIFAPMWDFIKILAWDAWVVISYMWGIVAEWFRVNVTEPLMLKFSAVWEYIKKAALDAWAYIQTQWRNAYTWFTTNVILPLQNAFTKVWDAIKTGAANAWQYISDKFKALGTWAQSNIVDPIKNAFGIALDWIRNKWAEVFNGIVSITKNSINGVIGALNRMINSVVSGINSFIATTNNLGSTLPGWTNIPSLSGVNIPYLAKGAVIPPNAEFLAVLGDQKSGRNIEAPENLIRQIVREESGSNGGGGEIVIRFEGSLSQFIRELKPYIEREDKRRGTSLAFGGA